MKKPNFFIVGAPKCGTTAMNDYLAQHPALFMAVKEVHYFGSDLHVRSRPTESEYLQLFQKANGATVVGEASVWYLFSKTAAAEIKAFSPQAKILIMLRNPVDVLYALHSQHLYDGNEDVPDFKTAISLDAERKQGRKLPRSADYTQLPPYLDSVLFHEQVKRYLDVFGSDQVYIVLYEDFVADTQKAVTETLRFLGVDATAPADYMVVNANKQVRNLALHHLLKAPPSQLKRIARRLLPSKWLRHEVMRFIFKQNVQLKKRTPMNPELRDQLISKVAGDVRALSTLINRDLSAWLK